ncbi:MAG: DUF5011 domain-containing protein [Bacteroidales bacterium]|nr:DUF5011 domain-containing protein [Bacteroidales bacterium]
MKNKITIFLSLIILISLSSCQFYTDIDTTGDVSYVSTKPVITLLGEPIMSLQVGDNYVDAGVEAFATEDTILNAEIVSGIVDANTEGFYVVTYKATNGFNWSTYAYRSVLVHDGTPYTLDIAGTYRIGFQFYSDVQKYSIDGYWEMTNVFAEEGVTLSIVFADMGDGVNYTLVPGEHITKGQYYGTAVKSGNKLIFTMTFLGLNGSTTVKNFEWTKA